jgi:hypothetical protein
MQSLDIVLKSEARMTCEPLPQPEVFQKPEAGTRACRDILTQDVVKKPETAMTARRTVF